jgi:hypothetical protein
MYTSARRFTVPIGKIYPSSYLLNLVTAPDATPVDPIAWRHFLVIQPDVTICFVLASQKVLILA